MLVLPRMTTPAALSRAVTVASYGGRQPSRILDPQVVGTPSIVMTSLSASGTPASGPVSSPASTRLAWASAPSVSTCRKACTLSSTAAIRSRCAWVTSTALASPLSIAARVSTADSRVRSDIVGQDLGDAEAAVLGGGRGRQHLLARERRGDDVGAGDVL